MPHGDPDESAEATSSPQLEPNWIVRGGVVTPQQLANGVREHLAVPGLAGFSVQFQPGQSKEQLAAAGRFPHSQISYTTDSELMAAVADYPNVRLIKSPGRGFHHTVAVPMPIPQDLAQALSDVFRQMSNPSSTVTRG
ncbi:MAG TPA: hypothetical protein VMP03_13130 [Methylomirabilota bacterium]|nr:hypothetical protein [Methylomirabilota bacterium]